jgi:Flp pilus assembly protein CpaB
VHEDYLRNTVDVVGSLLSVSVVEGQVFTKACFGSTEIGARLAATLPEKMRAVSLSLGFPQAGAVYAGCLVDVLVSFPRTAEKGGAVSTVLLQRLEVLAVDNQSVVSSAKEIKDADERGSIQSARERMITLLVDSRQAKALQLAVKYGSVSLAMRNPKDTDAVNLEMITLSELSEQYSGFLAQLTASITPPDVASQPVDENPVSIEDEPRREVWEMMIIRGGATETQSFPLPTGAVGTEREPADVPATDLQGTSVPSHWSGREAELKGQLK